MAIMRGLRPQNASKPIGKNKSNSNKFKVRHEYYNIVSQSTFKITKKFFFDISWVYKVKYESGKEHVFTETDFQMKVDKGVFKRVTDKVTRKVAEEGHFGESDLFHIT
jgi:hypothetical protein